MLNLLLQLEELNLDLQYHSNMIRTAKINGLKISVDMSVYTSYSKFKKDMSKQLGGDTAAFYKLLTKK